VKFSTGLPGLTRYPPITQDWEKALRAEDFQVVARTVDELGFDSLAIPEHIVMPTDMVELMGPFWTHALTAMAFVAGATSRIVVDSSVVVLPYHEPITLAKAISTLDFLSGGRVRLSVGVGHAAREFEALGVPFSERGRMTDEYLAAMVELWSSAKPEFHGEHVNFADVAFEPKPTQRPHPPIWIGGNSRAAMRRAARHDGWLPWLITAEQLPECLDYIHSRPAFASRTRPFDVALPLSTLNVSENHRPLDDNTGRAAVPRGRQATIDAIGHLADVGVTWVSIPTPSASSLSEYLDGLHWLAEEVLSAFRADG
jgi:probable F420-dependent oxidoreductase